MSNIFSFGPYIPVVHPSSYIHPNASVIGNVVIGANVYIGPSAVLRGDWGEIIVKDGCNVQENCTIHMFPGVTVYLDEGAHIGHGAVIHGAVIGANALIGMNAVILDNAVIGANSVVGALCMVPSEMKIPERKVVVGNPAKIIKDVTDDMLAWKTQGTELYQSLPQQCFDSLKSCEPLREEPVDRPVQPQQYHTWRDTARITPVKKP